MRIPEKFWLGGIVVLGGAILVAALVGDQGWREVRRLRAERRDMVEEIAALRSQRGALEREVRALREDPRSVEARAREDLGMIREGETVFLLPERHAPNP